MIHDLSHKCGDIEYAPNQYTYYILNKPKMQ